MISVDRSKIKLENIVGSFHLGRSINLSDLYNKLLFVNSEITRELAEKRGDFYELVKRIEKEVPQVKRKRKKEETALPIVVRYRPSDFPGLILKIRVGVRASLLVFSSGNVIITGCKSKKELEKAAEIATQLFKRSGIETYGIPTVSVQNIVASYDIGDKYNIDLETVALSAGPEVSYEPEIFPGCIYRLQQPKAVLLLFKSGKIVCTGCKSEEAVALAIEKVLNKLQEFGALIPVS